MSKIDTVKWKEYEVGELFDIETCMGFNTDKIILKEIPTDVYCYEFIGRTRKNYGLQGYVKNLGVLFNNKGTITISQVGTITAQYRKEDYYASQNMFKLTLKEDNKTSKHKLFLVSVLDKKLVKYTGYSHYPTLQSIKIEKIKLPTKNNEPDWEYMENYITEIENKYINKLEQHNNEKIEQALKVTGLSKEALNEELKVEPAKRYEKFRVGDLFDCDLGKYLPSEELNKSGKIPVITGITVNNGIAGYIDKKYDNFLYREVLTMSNRGIYSGTTYYHNYLFLLGPNAIVMQPKTFKINKYIGLYLATHLNKLTYGGYSNYPTKSTIVDDIITLPAIDENTPDFEYMEKAIYIYTLDKLFKIGNYLTKKK